MRRLGRETRDPAGVVVGQAINHLPEDVGATMPNLRAMKKKVHYARRGAEPQRPEPQAISGWAFPEEYAFFQDGTPFLLHDSGINDPQR